MRTSSNQQISLPFLKAHHIALYIKREDALHPVMSGNKYRKLKYNIEEARAQKHQTLLSFGGAHSNHIGAVAAAGKEYGFKTIGIIRGEELAHNWKENPTLHKATQAGMQLHFLTRGEYREKDSSAFLQKLKEEFGSFYLLPEGGTNALAVKGCEEILSDADKLFDVICCSVGTGGTVAGISNSACENQRVIGFSALAGDFLKKDIRKFARNKNWELVSDYHFGGYAKVNKELIDFMNDFKAQTNILLDPVYTAKMIYGLFHMIKNNKIKRHSKILAIHTGGLQGIAGMNLKLKKKNLPLIHT